MNEFFKWVLGALGVVGAATAIYKVSQKKSGLIMPGNPIPTLPFKPISKPMDSPFANDFIQSKNFTPANRSYGNMDWVVIHTMENKEAKGQARNVAVWFADAYAPKDPAPRASVHYCVDDEEIIQTLQEKNIAWGAAGANDNGIHIEHAGIAKQTANDWTDQYSLNELELSAKLSADICKRNGIEPNFLNASDLLKKPHVKGFTGHVNVNEAFKQGDHTDPGSNFPWDWYLGRVRFHLYGSGGNV